jgi:hypothetical protein
VFNLFKKKKSVPSVELTPEQDKFLASAIMYHNKNNEILNEEWSFNEFEEWGFDQISGIFFLRLSDDTWIEADGQIYGSFSQSDGSWEWAWNNPMVEEAITKDSLLIKNYGESEGIEYLTEGMILVPDIMVASYLAAIGEKLCNAQGSYPADAGSITVFIGLKNLRRKG